MPALPLSAPALVLTTCRACRVLEYYRGMVEFAQEEQFSPPLAIIPPSVSSVVNAETSHPSVSPSTTTWPASAASMGCTYLHANGGGCKTVLHHRDQSMCDANDFPIADKFPRPVTYCQRHVFPPVVPVEA